MTKNEDNRIRYSGLQPQYFPRLHYFARILDADVFVFRDDAQFVRKHKYPNGSTDKSYQAHTPIKQATGRQFLTVMTKHEGFMPLAKTKISYDQKWADDHLKTLIYDIILPKEIKKASESKALKNNNPSANEKIIALCKEVGAGEDYCGGTGAAAYMDDNLFSKNGINVVVQDWKCEEYLQQFNKKQGFIPDLSILDLLFNVSVDDARKILC